MKSDISKALFSVRKLGMKGTFWAQSTHPTTQKHDRQRKKTGVCFQLANDDFLCESH